MKILITKETVGSKDTRKAFVAMVYDGMRGLLTGEKLTIEVSPDVDLETACAAIRSIAGIIDMGADAVRGAPDDEDKDDADAWKYK